MTDQISIDPKTTALVVMDYQLAIVESHAPDKETLLPRMAGLLAAARAAGVLVVYVVVGFRPGFPEAHPRSLSATRSKAANRMTPSDPAAAIHPQVAPLAGDPVVTKHRVGAFQGTDLDMILRAGGVGTLMLAGVSTSGCVLSSVRYAADADYSLVVVADCCSDPDAEVHRMLTQTLFPRQAVVAQAQAVIDALA